MQKNIKVNIIYANNGKSLKDIIKTIITAKLVTGKIKEGDSN